MAASGKQGNRPTLKEGPHAAGWLSLNRVGAACLWVVIWQLASMVVGSKVLLASPFDTLVRLVELIDDPRFLSVVGFSLVRVVLGFLVAYALAVVLAFVAYRWPTVARLLAPGISALKSVPIACVIVLLLIWVGSRRVSAIAVFLAVFPAVYFSCGEGLAQVDVRVSELLTVFDVRGPVRLLAHVWPSIVPYLVGTSKNVCGMAWKAGVAAELIGSPMGSLGERIYQAKILLETADLFAWTIVVVAVSALCERLFVALLSKSDQLSRKGALALAKAWRSRGPLAEDEIPAPSDIVLTHATLGYESTVVARDVNVDLGPGSRTVLVDASGAGKTTMIRTVASLQPVLAGDALLLPPTASVVFQEARLVERMTAVQNVLLVAGGLLDEQDVRALLGELLPPEAVDAPVAELSGGQRRRVELVRAIAHPSAAVLLDEPFASLDEEAHHEAAAFVRRHLRGRTLLVASHMPGDALLLGAKELRLFDA